MVSNDQFSAQPFVADVDRFKQLMDTSQSIGQSKDTAQSLMQDLEQFLTSDIDLDKVLKQISVSDSKSIDTSSYGYSQNDPLGSVLQSVNNVSYRLNETGGGQVREMNGAYNFTVAAGAKGNMSISSNNEAFRTDGRAELRFDKETEFKRGEMRSFSGVYAIDSADNTTILQIMNKNTNSNDVYQPQLMVNAAHDGSVWIGSPNKGSSTMIAPAGTASDGTPFTLEMTTNGRTTDVSILSEGQAYTESTEYRRTDGVNFIKAGAYHHGDSAAADVTLMNVFVG